MLRLRARGPHARRLRLVSAAGLLVACAGIGCNQPRFDYEYSFGLKVAQSRQIPLMLYFADFTTTLHREFINRVFPHADVRKELAQTENVALTWQWGPAPKRYGVTAPHVFIMCRGDGTEVDRLTLTTPPTPADFLAWLRAARALAVGSPAGSTMPATQPAP